MTVLRQNFRKWWMVPRKFGEQPEDRRVTFLELFYDLVYVVIIAEIAHTLSGDISPAGFIGYAFLFVIVWWAWLNGTFYHDLHGNNDFRTRVFTFLQMFTVASMAVFAHNALGKGSTGFALSTAAFLFILTYLWWRTGVHDPEHRPMSRPYSLIFLLSAMLFAGSTLVPPPTRFYLWGLTLVLGFLITLRMLPRLAPVLDSETGEFSYISHSAVERFGLFTIIVLGEVIVGVVGGVASQETFLVSVGLTAALGMLIAIGFWWVYFDFVSHRLPSRTQTTVMGWLGLHLPMTLCIAAAGAAVLHIVEHSGDPLTAEVRWLLVVAVALVLVSIAALMQTIQIPDNFRPLYRRGGILTFLAGVIIASLGFTNLDTIPLLALLIVLMLTPIFYGLKVWIVELGAEEIVV